MAPPSLSLWAPVLVGGCGSSGGRWAAPRRLRSTAVPLSVLRPRSHDAAVPDLGGVQSRSGETLPRRPNEGKSQAEVVSLSQLRVRMSSLPSARPPEFLQHLRRCCVWREADSARSPIVLLLSSLNKGPVKPETSKIRVKSGLLEALPRLQSLNFHIVGLRVSKGRAPPPSASASCGVSVQFNPSVVSDSLRPHGLHHAKLPCPSPTPGVYSNSCPSSWWCHSTISSSVVPFSRLQSYPASGSFRMSQFFASGG